jgi:hypothetical protein
MKGRVEGQFSQSIHHSSEGEEEEEEEEVTSFSSFYLSLYLAAPLSFHVEVSLPSLPAHPLFLPALSLSLPLSHLSSNHSLNGTGKQSSEELSTRLQDKENLIDDFSGLM